MQSPAHIVYSTLVHTVCPYGPTTVSVFPAILKLPVCSTHLILYCQPVLIHLTLPACPYPTTMPACPYPTTLPACPYPSDTASLSLSNNTVSLPLSNNTASLSLSNNTASLSLSTWHGQPFTWHLDIASSFFGNPEQPALSLATCHFHLLRKPVTYPQCSLPATPSQPVTYQQFSLPACLLPTIFTVSLSSINNSHCQPLPASLSSTNNVHCQSVFYQQFSLPACLLPMILIASQSSTNDSHCLQTMFTASLSSINHVHCQPVFY